tara:strand:- start:1557 stop:1661 length:105 start_codon:yes stop_codon:yes gene_type:complete
MRIVKNASNLKSLNAIMGVGDIGEEAEIEFQKRF